MKRLKNKENDVLLDDVSWQIIRELQQNARISFTELGRRVGLSSPAVTERVRRLEEAGIITGYHASVDLKQIGRPILAIVRLGNPGDKSDQFVALIQQMPEITESSRITGNESFVMKVAVPSVEHLERVIRQLEPYGLTTTSLVLSTPVTQRLLSPLDED
ncbi:MAG: Lrp/AsnC family transcriptional regulator [Anaerolineae bacterium]|nr:Lrp/AsnC family transcriptional regulator [Anaerolineae bacterium]